MTRASGLIGRSAASTLGRKTYHLVRRFLFQSNSRALGVVARWSLRVKILVSGKTPTGAHRALVSTCQPIDPLAGAKFRPPIDVVIPFVEKDLRTLELVVESVFSCVANPIVNLFLVTPGDSKNSGPRLSAPQAQTVLVDLIKRFPQTKVRFDHEVLGFDLGGTLLASPGAQPDGWLLQQVLKFALARTSNQIATLVVDADTILLRRRTWLDGFGVQLLQFSEEYHHPYFNHFEGFFSIPKTFPASFVTHHQLMQTDIVREMFPDSDRLAEWLRYGYSDPEKKPSEYESYGSYLQAKHPRRARFGTWSNLWSPRLELAKKLALESEQSLEDLLADYCSVSFHAHAQID